MALYLLKITKNYKLQKLWKFTYENHQIKIQKKETNQKLEKLATFLPLLIKIPGFLLSSDILKK